jgi:hypothetical protein
MPEMVDSRGPEELECPGQTQQAQKADFTKVYTFLAKVHGKDVVEHAEGETLGEIEDANPEQLRAE